MDTDTNDPFDQPFTMGLPDAQRLVDEFKVRAGEVLVEDANHSPIMIACSPAGTQPVLMAGLAPPEMWQAGRALLASIQAFGYVMAIEAWTVVAKREDMERVAGGDEPGLAKFRRKASVPSPSQHPDRREVLMVHYQFKLPDGNLSGCWQLTFDRADPTSEGEGGTVTLGEWRDLDGGGKTAGRGVRLLDPPTDMDLPGLPGF